MNIKNKALLISLVVGSLYMIYLIVYFFGGSNDSSDATAKGLASIIVAPHMILVLLAVIFNALGYFKSTSGFALTGAILYSVAAGIFIPYAPFVIIEIICSFVGFSKLKKAKNTQKGA